MLARRFLYAIAALIVLALAGGLVWTLFPASVMRIAFVPSAAWRDPAHAPDYAGAAAWASRPGIADDPARFLPPGVAPAPAGRAAVFFVSPTTYLDRRHWNAAYDDPALEPRLRLVMAEGAAFAAAGRVWAPRYRQATVGAFLVDTPAARAARDLAGRDVARAFDAFLREAPADAPIVLAGHSQGSYHLLRLIAARIAGRPVAQRIAAVYAVGWPASVTADVPALRMPACTAPAQTRCVLGWESFAAPADPAPFHALYDATHGLTGAPRRGTPVLCVNPLTGIAGGAAPAAANLGALRYRASNRGFDTIAHAVPARCTAAGLLDIGAPPQGYGLVLPGNNYHVFDYALFWANIRADAARRVAAFR